MSPDLNERLARYWFSVTDPITLERKAVWTEQATLAEADRVIHQRYSLWSIHFERREVVPRQ